MIAWAVFIFGILGYGLWAKWCNGRHFRKLAKELKP